MSSKTTPDNQLYSTPTALAASRIVASRDASLDDTVSTSKDVQQALSLTKSLPMDLSRLLRTNDSPSTQDALIVSEWTRLLDHSIVQSDAAIAGSSLISSTALCASIDMQKTQRADLQSLRERVQSVISAVRQLPPEMWQQIFLFVNDSDEGVFIFHKQDPVYRIGQVCRKWRRISQQCPRLWSRFYVDGTQVANLAHGVSHLRTVLERSCSVPLDFSFRCGFPDGDEVFTQLFSLLMQYSLRWRSAEFCIMTFPEALLLGQVRGRIPRLQSVRLELDLARDESERRDMVSAFEIAPRLSHVDLYGIPLGQVLLDPRVNQKLEYLAVKHSADADLMFYRRTPTLSDVLRAYPKLRNLTHRRRSAFDDSIWHVPPPLNTPRTVYADITSLSVADGDSINDISLPNLTDLDAGLHARSDIFIPYLFPCVVSLLQHSRCRLTALHLRFAEWDEDSMGVLLSLAPDLERLSISSVQLLGTDGMMSVLTRFLGEQSEEDGLRPKYAPRLRRLYIDLSGKLLPKWTFISRVFLDMVAMREEYGALEVVELQGKCKHGEVLPHLCADDLKRWKDMCGRGLIETEHMRTW